MCLRYQPLGNYSATKFSSVIQAVTVINQHFRGKQTYKYSEPHWFLCVGHALASTLLEQKCHDTFPSRQPPHTRPTIASLKNQDECKTAFPDTCTIWEKSLYIVWGHQNIMSFGYGQMWVYYCRVQVKRSGPDPKSEPAGQVHHEINISGLLHIICMLQHPQPYLLFTHTISLGTWRPTIHEQLTTWV